MGNKRAEKRRKVMRRRNKKKGVKWEAIERRKKEKMEHNLTCEY